MKKRIHRILSLFLLLALLLGMLPAGGMMRAYAAETETVAAETEGSTEVPAVTEESTSEPEAEEALATAPEDSPEPDASEKEESKESEPLDETEPTDGAESFQDDKPARDPATGYGRPTGTVEELEAIPIPDEILANSYGLQIPVILYGTTTFSVSFKYPGDPKQTTYTREFDLIHKYKLYSEEEVQSFIDGNDTQLKELTEQRDRLSNQLRYLTLPEEAARVRALRDSLTKQAKALRKELATARTLLAGIAEKQRKIAIEQQMMRGPAQVSREKGVRRNEER